METAEAVQLEQPSVPAERTQLFTRDSYFKAPDWRYVQACRYIEDEEAGSTPAAPTDILVQYAIRGMKAMKTPEGTRYAELLWPELQQALWLGSTKADKATVAVFESYLMTGRDIAPDYGMSGDSGLAVVCDLYGKLFFDLSGIAAVHSWISDYLFEPERHKGDSTLLRSRLLTYYGGLEGGVNAAITGAHSKECKQLMKEIGESERSKRVFDYLVKHTGMDRGEYVMIMEAALKSMSDRDFQEHMKDREDAGSSTLEELAQHLEEGVRAFSQHELAAVREDGVEVTNDYTGTILNKDNDNGK